MSKPTVEVLLLLIKIKLDDAVINLDSENYNEVREYLTSAIRYIETAFKITQEEIK